MRKEVCVQFWAPRDSISRCRKSENHFPAASKFAGKPFQQGISDSHSLLEFSEYCDPGRHANVVTHCLLTPCLNVPNRSMPNMTGRPGYRTMEMNGGSSAPYLARTPCVPLFCTLFNKGGNRRVFRLPGAGGDHFHCTVEPAASHIRCQIDKALGAVSRPQF